MAFLKYAKANVVKPAVSVDAWHNRVASSGQTSIALSREASKVVLQQYDPANFLLTHCTIIASVDSETVAAPLGTQQVDGFQIDRKYADFYITPESSQWINNNNDAWERKLLMSCFRTFVGGENYVEHIQIPAMSKGKIIDAAARDVGGSIYIDILVATNRKHAPLIRAITSEQLTTLSMGCQVQFTVCSKCGNVAYDESQLCPHVRYFKGSEFIDDLGKKRKIAELCGHSTQEPGSVKFIEASWVANPAFTGAVLRSILTAEEAEQMAPYLVAAYQGGPRTADADMIQRAAHFIFPADPVGAIRENHKDARTLPREFVTSDPQAPFALASGSMDTIVRAKAAEWNEDIVSRNGHQPRSQDEFPSPPPPKAEDDADPMDKIVKDFAKTIRERAIEELRSEMGKGEAKKVEENTDPNRNDTMIKSALKHEAWREIAKTVIATTPNTQVARKILLGLILYKNGGWAAVKTARALTGREVLAVSRFLDRATKRASMAGEHRIYRTVLAVGGMVSHNSANKYLAACTQVVGRQLTEAEVASLLHKGRLYDLGSN